MVRARRGKRADWSPVLTTAGAAFRALNPDIYRGTVLDIPPIGKPALLVEKPPAVRTTVDAGRVPNKTERRYHDDFLAPRVAAGEVEEPIYDALVFRIGEPGARCSYRVDWAVWNKRERILELHEVKGGHVWEDAKVKFEAARRLYPWARWVWGRWTREKGQVSGSWDVKAFEPRATAVSA